MKKTQKTKKDFLSLLFILPSLAGMCFFYIVPFLSTLYYSLINNMADKKWGKMVLFFSADSADCTLRNHHCLLEIGFRKDRAYQQSVADGGK